MLPQAVLFDLDDTLIASAPLHEAAYLDALARYAPGTPFRYEEFLGMPTRAVLARLVAPEHLERALSHKQSHYRQAVAEGRVLPLPGCEQILAYLAEQGVPSYIVTGASRQGATAVLQALHLNRWIAGAVFAEDTPRGKPHPDPYLQCLANHNLEASRCIAVEDSPQGAQSARAAGLPTVVIHPRNPEATYQTLHQLLDHLKRD